MVVPQVDGGYGVKACALVSLTFVSAIDAKVALARKLAVILHRMLADGTPFKPARSARPLAAERPSLRRAGYVGPDD